MEQGPPHLAMQARLMPRFIQDEQGMLVAVYEPDA